MIARKRGSFKYSNGLRKSLYCIKLASITVLTLLILFKLWGYSLITQQGEVLTVAQAARGYDVRQTHLKLGRGGNGRADTYQSPKSVMPVIMPPPPSPHIMTPSGHPTAMPPHPGWNQTDWPVWWFSPFFDPSSFGREAATTVLSMVR